MYFLDLQLRLSLKLALQKVKEQENAEHELQLSQLSAKRSGPKAQATPKKKARHA